MSKVILVQVPSYVYLRLDPGTLEKVLNAGQYEYDWEKKVYWLSDSERMEVRVADTADLQLTRKPVKEEEAPE
jgi:hypothetical protein